MVTGCAAQIDPAAFAAMPEVDRVLGNLDKFSAEAFMPAFAAEIRLADIMTAQDLAPHLAASYSERSRAFLEVQNGCDHRCTFCIIPFGRGNSRSVPAGLVVERVKALVGEGCREVVLTGVDVTSYGPDLPGAPSLGMLVERILRHVPDLPRLRLSSLDCIEMDERLFELAAGEPRFMPHLHMSFQSGDDMVLKRMKRRHSRAQAVETVARLKARRPEIAIGADLIAGFPTETHEMHLNSLALIDDCDIVMGHIFPYSPKAGTPAARMPQVAPQVVKERAKRLREAAARRRAAWLQGLVETRQTVLMERGGLGHTESFAPVRLRYPDNSSGAAFFAADCGHSFMEDGELVEVVIIGLEQDVLVGAPA
jgi:threonylcarbamoyladenosine tRNA methylthiotransferase MtaB